MEISREDFERLVRSDTCGKVFASIVLAAMDEDAGFACVDAAIVKTALRAIYPDAYEAEMQRRHAVKTPLYEIKAEDKDGDN